METDEVLAQWEAEEAAVRARFSTGNVRPLQNIAGLTGLQVLEAMFTGELPPPPIGITLELKVNMLRPLNVGVPLVRAEGKVIHVGRQVATAEGRLVGHNGKLYAHATTTCLIFDQ